MQLLQDIKSAVRLTGEIRKARKAGASGAQLRPYCSIPVVTLKPAHLNTMEGSLVWNVSRDAYQFVQEIFDTLPHEAQRRLEYSPEAPGAWAERARFWRRELKSALPPKMYHRVMALFISWYIRCLRRARAQEATI